MDIIGGVFQVLGNAVNGLLQVIADFVQLLADTLPNPDPFPQIVEELPVDALAGQYWAWHWVDVFVGVDYATGVIGAWAGLMVASVMFAVVYWVVKAVKP